ncbi:MAG TPA: SIR2 family protein [Blastocatellia bacterium]|nr:SIR2 family protein [Blastocatellia bacterium]
MSDQLDEHYDVVTKAITDGRVVPFLGAGVNLWNRGAIDEWRPGRCPPSGWELTKYLAKTYKYPETGAMDLARVSQYVAVTSGSGPLYEELHSLFCVAYEPNPLHRFLARLPSLMREKNYPRSEDPLRRRLLVVTTNYDDILERAFEQAGEPFHVVSYLADMAKPEQCGKFLHRGPEGACRLIEAGNEYEALIADQHPVLLKIHGAVDCASSEYDSFVITEDHYIDYLTRTDISSVLPVPLPAILKKSHFLFLGYSLRDWNLRAILRRIWREQKVDYKSWAIQLDPEEMDKKFWKYRDVEIHNQRLEDYVVALSRRLDAAPAAGATR